MTLAGAGPLFCLSLLFCGMGKQQKHSINASCVYHFQKLVTEAPGGTILAQQGHTPSWRPSRIAAIFFSWTGPIRGRACIVPGRSRAFLLWLITQAGSVAQWSSSRLWKRPSWAGVPAMASDQDRCPKFSQPHLNFICRVGCRRIQ